MNFTKQTEETCSDFTERKYSQNQSQLKSELVYVPDQKRDEQNGDKIFYKSFSQGISNQSILKHSHRAFKISRSQQDLALFCLSLLQFQAEFPLKFFIVDPTSHQNDAKQKQVWLETQFLLSPLTACEELLSRQIKQGKLQNKVYRFFSQSLLPLLIKFKQERINWAHMITEDYMDQKVIKDFNDNIVQRINKSFKSYCKSS